MTIFTFDFLFQPMYVKYYNSNKKYSSYFLIFDFKHIYVRSIWCLIFGEQQRFCNFVIGRAITYNFLSVIAKNLLPL